MPRNPFSLKITLPDTCPSRKTEQTLPVRSSKSSNTMDTPPNRYGKIDTTDAPSRYDSSLRPKVKNVWHPSVLAENGIETWAFAYGSPSSKGAKKRNHELMQPNMKDNWDPSSLQDNEVAVEDFADSKESASSKGPEAQQEDMIETEAEAARKIATRRASFRARLRRWSSSYSKSKPTENPSEKPSESPSKPHNITIKIQPPTPLEFPRPNIPTMSMLGPNDPLAPPPHLKKKTSRNFVAIDQSAMRESLRLNRVKEREKEWVNWRADEVKRDVSCKEERKFGRRLEYRGLDLDLGVMRQLGLDGGMRERKQARGWRPSIGIVYM